MSARSSRGGVSARGHLQLCYHRVLLIRSLLRTHDPAAEAETIYGLRTRLDAAPWRDQLRTVTSMLDRADPATIRADFWASGTGRMIEDTLRALEDFAQGATRAKLAGAGGSTPAYALTRTMGRLWMTVRTRQMSPADMDAACEVERLLPTFERPGLDPARLTTEQLVEFCLCEQWATYLHTLYCEPGLHRQLDRRPEPLSLVERFRPMAAQRSLGRSTTSAGLHSVGMSARAMRV